MSQKQTDPLRILIIGGGFGGVRAALELGKIDSVSVTLVSDREDFYYYPTLYRTATGGSDQESIIPLAEIFADDPVEVILGTATDIDADSKIVSLEDGTELPYDRVIFSLGVVTNYFNIPGLAENSYGVKSPYAAERLKRHLHAQLIAENKPDTSYVIVGGGPTGIELAGELAVYLRTITQKHGVKRRAIHIDLVEAMPHLMPRLPKPIGKSIAQRLRKLGVKLHLGAKVESASEHELMVSGKPIRSHTIIWTAGIANHPFFTRNKFALSQRGKVLVDEFLRAEGFKDIFILGDNAETPYSGMAQTAIYDAEFVAHNIRFELEGRPKLAYRSKEPVYLTPVGPGWASLLWGDVHVKGRLGWMLRNAANLHAFSQLLPTTEAVVQWTAADENQDLCPVCSSAEDI